MLDTLRLLGLSTTVVTTAEIGDKTQLLALLLASRFRAPWPICLGILSATIANHAAAGLLGAAVGSYLDPELLRWILVVSFLGMAAWILIPDRASDSGLSSGRGTLGIFGTTFVLFFLAEIGDKTQLATVALAAANVGQTLVVVIGTTLGMMIADLPAVFLGDRLVARMPLPLLRRVSAAIFVGLAALSACARL